MHETVCCCVNSFYVLFNQLTCLLVSVAQPDTVHVQATSSPQHVLVNSVDIPHLDVDHRETVVEVHEQHNAEVSVVFVLQNCSCTAF